MRFAIPALLFTLATTSIPVCAFGSDNKIPDQQSIDALAAKANQAPQRDQCFLYAELVHQMTEFSARQYAAGDVEKATLLLKQVQGLTRKIHLSVAGDEKRIRNAEILLSRTAFRLTGLLHSSSFEDQSLVAETLADVNQVQTETMLQVFRK
jgi:hypothetical protein